MTDCIAVKSNCLAFDAAYHLARRMIRQARTLTIIATAILLIAGIFGWHPPDPSRCEPGSESSVITQTVSANTFTLGCPTGLKYTIR